MLLVVGGSVSDAHLYHERDTLPFRVLADENGEVSRQFGLDRWMMGAMSQSGVVVVSGAGIRKHQQINNLPRIAIDLDAVKHALHDN